jgi:hypothetical protein
MNDTEAREVFTAVTIPLLVTSMGMQSDTVS